MEIIVKHDIGIHGPKLRKHLVAKGDILCVVSAVVLAQDRIVVLTPCNGCDPAVTSGPFRCRAYVSDLSGFGPGHKVVDTVPFEAHFGRTDQRNDIRVVDDVVDAVIVRRSKLLRLVRSSLRRFDAVRKDRIVLSGACAAGILFDQTLRGQI